MLEQFVWMPITRDLSLLFVTKFMALNRIWTNNQKKVFFEGTKLVIFKDAKTGTEQKYFILTEAE